MGTFEGGTAALGVKADRASTTGLDRSWSRSQERAKPDGGFTQVKAGGLARAQKAGDVLAGAGAKVELLDPTQHSFDHVTETNHSKSPNTFVGSRVGTRGSEQVTVGADGVSASFQREAVNGRYAEKSGRADGKYGTAEYAAQAKAEARATVSADAKLDSNGLTANVGARAELTAEASIRGSAQTRPVKVAGVELRAGVEGTAKVSARLGAEATGKVQVTRNPPTAVVQGSVGASAVLKAEADVKVSAGPFAVHASGYGSAGAEAKASGVLGYHDGKLEVGGSVGAALGLGLGGSATVEVDVKQLGTMAANATHLPQAVSAVKSAADVNHDGKLGLDDARAAGAAAVDGAKSAVSAGAHKVASLFGW